MPRDPEFVDERSGASPPSDPLGTRRTSVGIVKWWRGEKGYGAIACADTAPWDIWFHFATLSMKGIVTLPSGAKVEAISRGNSGTFDLATGEQILFGVLEGTEARTIQAGDRVEVDFIRADQESFKYVAYEVRPVKL